MLSRFLPRVVMLMSRNRYVSTGMALDAYAYDGMK